MTRKATSRPNPLGQLPAEQLAALGARLLERRRQLELAQQELACRTGLRRERLSRLENGRTVPTLSEVCALARELGLSLDHLVLGPPPPPAPVPAEWMLPQLVEISSLGSPEDLALLNRFLVTLAHGLRVQGPSR